jgi:hypothetical protein
MKSHGKNLQVVTITVEEATYLLEMNGNNRPLNDQHVQRIARQIRDGKWKFNGDTIKISSTNDILDGQHRLWAVVESKTPIETILVRDIQPDAFATIDTLRKPRSGSDILALIGATNNRSTISVALQWLIRWQRKTLTEYKAPANRIENSDIEQAYRDNPGIARAAESCSKLRAVANPGLLSFFYFVLTNRNPDLAERMIHTLANPAGVGITDPFFLLRAYFLNDKGRKDPLVSIALMVKASNAAYKGKEMKLLKWQNQGTLAEPFPTLDVSIIDPHHR